MDAGELILRKAKSLFDVAGASRLNNSEILLLLGLGSTPERDLDAFGHVGDTFHMYGFEKHVAPKLDEIIEFIRNLGFKVESIGRIGYPLQGEINLKNEAVRTGIGRRGKNTVILHPEYGPWLRFMAVTTNAPLEAVESDDLQEEENPVCRGCRICLDVCPVHVLEPYRMPDIRQCLSYLNPIDEKGNSILCDLCIKSCPAGKEK